jgi:hypothetical protein
MKTINDICRTIQQLFEVINILVHGLANIAHMFDDATEIARKQQLVEYAKQEALVAAL